MAPRERRGDSIVKDQIRFELPQKEMPEAWYNIAADLPFAPSPPLHPGTHKPLGPDDLAPLFPPSLIEQEMSQERHVDIPGPVLDVYRRWRPSPLFRARALERALDTPARIYYKHEGVSPAGSHKPNTAVAQAYYNHRDGTRRLATETGAGQWGSALSIAACAFGLDCTVYMVRVSYDGKPYRRSLMQIYGADVLPSPSPTTSAGRAVLESDPESPGSLGIAISEAVEDAAGSEDTCYALGSVLNHVLLHQTVIGLETVKQMKLADDAPEYIVGCCGGGSNFAGLAFPFLGPCLNGSAQPPRLIAVEPAACPTLTRGVYAYDYGDAAGMTPLVRMHTLGHDFVPAGIHAGGLRYHGEAPLLSLLCDRGYIEARAVKQLETFEAAVVFARAEGIVPAPESAHAIRTTIDLALEARDRNQETVILMGLSGHGHFDLAAYDAFLSGSLTDYDHPEAAIASAVGRIPRVSGEG